MARAATLLGSQGMPTLRATPRCTYGVQKKKEELLHERSHTPRIRQGRCYDQPVAGKAFRLSRVLETTRWVYKLSMSEIRLGVITYARRLSGNGSSHMDLSGSMPTATLTKK